jgi:hypothetical protein
VSELLELLYLLGVLGVLAFALALVLAYALRPTSPLRVTLFLAGGFAVAGALFLWGFVSAPTDGYPEGCSDCSEWLGRYWEPGLVIFFSLLNLAGWFVGSLTGLAVRIQRGR